MWKELRKLGLLSKTQTRVELHGLTPKELNSHFAGVSVSTEECEDDLNKVSQPKGEDGIPQSVIAKALPVIGSYLVDIFNTSMSNGIFPKLWKKAHLVPLKKSVIPSAVTDFRPIVLLSFLSKVLEKNCT